MAACCLLVALSVTDYKLRRNGSRVGGLLRSLNRSCSMIHQHHPRQRTWCQDCQEFQIDSVFRRVKLNSSCWPPFHPHLPSFPPIPPDGRTDGRPPRRDSSRVWSRRSRASHSQSHTHSLTRSLSHGHGQPGERVYNGGKHTSSVYKHRASCDQGPTSGCCGCRRVFTCLAFPLASSVSQSEPRMDCIEAS